MEYIEGGTLTDYIKSRGCLPTAEAITYFRSIVEAIDYIHCRGIVHRDIKSNNVKVTPSGQVKLLDFGIAKSGASPSLTVTGAFVGTLQYLSPEQLIGGVADVRSDISALGVLLYEMTTSHLPFEANTIGELCKKITKASYTPPSVINQSVPRGVQNVITRCLKKNPGDRYKTAQDLLKDVDRVAAELSGHSSERVVLSGATVPSQPRPYQQVSYQTPPSQPAYQPQLHDSDRHAASNAEPEPKSKVLLFSAIAVVLLVVVVGAIYFMLSGDNTEEASNKSVQVLENFKIETADGPADVYRNGHKVGTTPYPFQARVGEELDLVLKRDGYLDKPVHLTTSTNQRTRTFMLNKKP
jgi:serine/threonine-protein kinase